jgi:Mg/Co/Ni transporter MgtE
MIGTSEILRGKILIVDDQEANVILLERMLRGAGYVSIESTTDPAAACKLHLENYYDLILLDLMMPGVDGFQVMEDLKKIETDGYLSVLVITAEPDHKLRALQAGAKDFVSKPLDLSEVLARVHNLLEVRLLHEEAKKLYNELVAEHQRLIELSAQPGAMVGVVEGERLATHWLMSLKLRHPWLQLNLLTAFGAAAVVGMFQGTLDRMLILTMFLPVLADQSGNTGSQALAITLRGITLGDLETGKKNDLVRKEALLGLLNGALVGLVAAFVMYAIASFQGLPTAFMLGAVVFLAMIASCIISGICGAIVPLVLKRFGTDPATASTILLTTVTNVASMGILLGLAAVLV